jgi:hypothetical protein
VGVEEDIKDIIFITNPEENEKLHLRKQAILRDSVTVQLSDERDNSRTTCAEYLVK